MIIRPYNVAFPILPDFDVIDDHEMVLFPMHDAGQRCLTQLLKRDMHTNGAKADALGGGADAEQTHPLPPDEALLPKRLQRVVLAIVLGHHPQARGPAVHRIELVVIWEGFAH